MDAFVRAGGLPEHYRCEVINRTQEEWHERGLKNPIHGMVNIIYGLTGQILYIPCLIVFLQKDLFQLPVYKIMFYITIIDIINLGTNSVMTGFLLFEGAVYCNYPYFMYIWGSVEVGMWIACCIGCFFLVLTRLIDLMNPEIHEKLFAGKRIIFTFIIMFLYVFYFIWYCKPVLFNSMVATWIFDPFIYDDGRDLEHFGSLALIVNNMGTVTTTLAMYFIFFVVFIYKMSRTYHYTMDTKQKQILAQSCIICLNNMALAVIYVSFTFWTPSMWLITLSVRCWQFSSGSGVIVFYVMNRTVRERIFTLLGIRRLLKASTVNPSLNTSKPIVTSQSQEMEGRDQHLTPAL